MAANLPMNDPYGLIASGLPPELTGQLMGLSQQQQIAQALMQQSMSPLHAPEVKGRFQGRISPMEGIAKLVQAYMGGQGLADANKGYADLGDQYQKSLMDTLTKSDAARMGTPGTPASAYTDTLGSEAPESNIPATPGVKGSSSVANALLMQHPATRALGQQLMQQQLEMDMVKQVLGQGSPAGGSSAVLGGSGGTGGSIGKGGPPMELLAAGPLGQSVFKALEERSKGIAQRPGAPIVNPYDGTVIAQPTPAVAPGVQLTVSPQGSTAAPVPGYNPAAAATIAATTAAKEGAELPYRTVEQQQASGAKIPVPATAVLGQNPGAQAPPQPAPQIPQAILDADKRGPFTATQVPGQEPQITMQGKTDPWASMPKRQVPQGVGQSSFDASMASHQAETASKLSEKYGQKADDANNRIALNNQASALIDKADTGPMAAQIGDVKNWLVSRFGVPEDDFQNTPSATAALQKDLVNAATQRAKQQFGSRITQSEVMLMLTKGAPNVDMPKAAMKYLVDTDTAMAKYTMQQGSDLGRYLQQGGDPQQFESWHAQAFPASHALEDVKLQTGTPQRRASDLVPMTKTIGNKTYVKRDGQWFEQ